VKEPALSLGRPGGNRAPTVDPTKQALTVEAHGTPDTDTRDSAITGEGVDLRGSHSKEARRFGGRQHWRRKVIPTVRRVGAQKRSVDVRWVGRMDVMFCRGLLLTCAMCRSDRPLAADSLSARPLFEATGTQVRLSSSALPSGLAPPCSVHPALRTARRHLCLRLSARWVVSVAIR